MKRQIMVDVGIRMSVLLLQPHQLWTLLFIIVCFPRYQANIFECTCTLTEYFYILIPTQLIQ